MFCKKYLLHLWTNTRHRLTVFCEKQLQKYEKLLSWAYKWLAEKRVATCIKKRNSSQNFQQKPIVINIQTSIEQQTLKVKYYGRQTHHTEKLRNNG